MTRSKLFLCLTGAMMLTGCDKFASRFESEAIKTTTIEGKVRGSRSGGEQLRAWRDPATGCQYLIWERPHAGSITPRLTPEGRPMCGPAGER